jgi:SecD/SecF fusion protein
MDSALQISGWFAFFGLFLGYLFTSDPRRKRRFGWTSVVLAVGLSIMAATPLGDRELIPFVEKQARNKDKVFEELMIDVRKRAEGFKGSEFGLLKDAIESHNKTVDEALKKAAAEPQAKPAELPQKIDLRKYFINVPVPKEKAKSLTDANEAVLLEVQRRAGGKVRLGLDLKGGSSFLLQVETKGDPRALEQAKSVLLKRVDKLGLAEPVVQPIGTDRILIQLPGVSEAQREMARQTVQQTAFLEFRLVDPENAVHSAQAAADPTFNVPGYKKYEGIDEDEKGNTIRRIYFFEGGPARLTGDGLARALPDVDEHGNYSVRFELKPQARDRFGRLTEENIGRQLAIVLDGEVQSAPVIQSAITGGTGQITGRFTREQVLQLSMVLNNPLGTPVKLIEERNVDASLGKDSIRSGVQAGIIGAIAVLLFVGVYYLLTGIIADIAVVLNVVILIGILALFEFTLTMPGIAGIVLTIGMAVDANVLINERIREELKAGKGLRAAISTGYSKAFSTIFDSNITTLITAVILILLGSGPVKGFGITLTIGLLVNMFTAVVVTRLILDFLVDRGWVKSLPMLHLIRNTKIDFIGMRFYAIGLSCIVILFGAVSFVRRGGLEEVLPKSGVTDVVTGAIHSVIPRAGLNVYGIDFKGGEAVTLNFDQKVETGAVRTALEAAGFTDVSIQYQRERATGRETLEIKVPTAEKQQQVSVTQVLTQKFPDAGFSEASREAVGAAVSSELKRDAFFAMVIACVLILIYVALRFEFSFGLGGVVALVHDTLVTIGLFSLTGRQFSLPMVAAILTIIGFSINDTIVIFDRVREDLKLYGGRMSFKDVLNRAINETLSRTLLTSGTVLLATLALYIWGGTVINDFAFTFLVGVITGSYSTIFIASPVVLWWHNLQQRKGAPVVLQEPKAAQRV